MLTTREIRNVKVCKPPRPGKEYTKDGLPRRRRKLGKVFKTVFSPDGFKVVGFIVRRPDLLWMIKRPERFLALDAVEFDDEGAINASKGSDSWDDKAIARLDVDWDVCILWEGIQVKDSQGSEIGRVDDISFDEQTGAVNSFFLDDGFSSRQLVGMVEIPVDMAMGYQDGYLIVADEAALLVPTGGLAGKAGEATAKIRQDAKKGVDTADAAIAHAYDKGAEGIGKAIKRTKGMVSDTRDEFRREAGPKPAARPKNKQGKSTASKAAAAAGRKAADHMKGVGSMFSEFSSEFKKARKGE